MKPEQLEQLQQQQQHIRQLFAQLLHIKNQLIPGQFCLFLPQANDFEQQLASGIHDIRAFKNYFANCLNFFDEQIQAQNELIADLPNNQKAKQYHALQADEINSFQTTLREIISELKEILTFGYAKNLQSTFKDFLSSLLNFQLTYHSLVKLSEQLIQLQIQIQQQPLRPLALFGNFNADIALLRASTQLLMDYQTSIERNTTDTDIDNLQENLSYEALMLQHMNEDKEKLEAITIPAFSICEKIQEIQVAQKKQAAQAVQQRLKERLIADDKDGTFARTRASAKALSCRSAATATCAEPMPSQTHASRRTVSARA